MPTRSDGERTTTKPESGEGVVVLTNRRDGQACRRDEMPTNKGTLGAKNDEASLTAARYRAGLDGAVSCNLVSHRRSISRAGSDGRKDNNNRVTAETHLPTQESATSSAS